MHDYAVFSDKIEGLGSYNDMPPNWRTITESEFFWLFGQTATARHEYRQVVLPTVIYGQSQDEQFKRELYCSVNFWVNPDRSGIGFITHYNGVATRSDIDAFWPQYFKFHVCDHKGTAKTTVSRRCYNEYECTNCGYKWSVDSSD